MQSGSLNDFTLHYLDLLNKMSYWDDIQRPQDEWTRCCRQQEDSCTNIASLSIPDRKWRDSRKHRNGLQWPWTSSRRRYPNGILLWLVMQWQYRSRNQKKLPVNLRYGVIIQHLSGPMDAGLKEFYCACLGCIMQTNKIIWYSPNHPLVIPAACLHLRWSHIYTDAFSITMVSNHLWFVCVLYI